MTIYHLGLIGYSLEHSLSPKIHTAALKACGLQGKYSLFPIAPEDKQGLKDLLNRVRPGELHGLNVTIPHKQNVIPLLDELTPTAKAIGAVNTIYLRRDKLIGDNTDAPGFLADLKKILADSPSPILGEGLAVREKSAIVLGAGGSARAVVYALLIDGWQITIAARRLEQAQQLTDSFPNYQVLITNLENLQSLTHRKHHPPRHDPEHRPIPSPRNFVIAFKCFNLRFGLQSTRDETCARRSCARIASSNRTWHVDRTSRPLL